MYIELLNKIKNAQLVKKESLKVPFTKNKERILEILASKGYIESFDKKGRGPKKILSIKLKYDDGKGVINGFKFISKPGQRIYIGYEEIKSVKSGYGSLVISTPNGIITGPEARKTKVGGEALFQIW